MEGRRGIGSFFLAWLNTRLQRKWRDRVSMEGQFQKQFGNGAPNSSFRFRAVGASVCVYPRVGARALSWLPLLPPLRSGPSAWVLSHIWTAGELLKCVVREAISRENWAPSPPSKHATDDDDGYKQHFFFVLQYKNKLLFFFSPLLSSFPSSLSLFFSPRKTVEIYNVSFGIWNQGQLSLHTAMLCAGDFRVPAPVRLSLPSFWGGNLLC